MWYDQNICMQHNTFILQSKFDPAGDQPQAIKKLVSGLKSGMQKQTLLGVTGSGKTFTIANVIEQIQKPTLIIAHNKTLAAQLAQEYKTFFPDHAVHYFVSYYDYYQPEAYIAVTDTYIEKDAQINEEIDRLRHATTQSLLTRSDVIIVASVSCIYGLGSPKEYEEKHAIFEVGQHISRRELLQSLIEIHYERTTADLKPGTFRALGSKIEIMPISETNMISLTMMGSNIVDIAIINPVTSVILEQRPKVFLFPAKHFITEETKRNKAIVAIKKELEQRLKYFMERGKLLEAERLKRRTNYDVAMMREIGYCSGIENYSRHLSGKSAGEPPETLLSYFPHDENGNPDFLLVIDESHVTTPQIGAMHGADKSRKENLVEHGFRLPSAKDNRPLQIDEFWERVGQTIFVSATPGKIEAQVSEQIAEQIIRPTGLIDPQIELLPVTPHHDVQLVSDEPEKKLSKKKREYTLVDVPESYPGQVQHFIEEAVQEIKNGGRILATTLTKRMAEDLADYLKDRKIRAEYLHSDVDTIDRIKILSRLRKGEFDCLIGVNLLREGLDLPEVTLVAIFDADKEGFLRSETSLIQTMGRAARNVDGRVILYADRITNSMNNAIAETLRRRELQVAYNKKHGITPKTVKKAIVDITAELSNDHEKTVQTELSIDLKAFGGNIKKLIKHKKQQMEEAVESLAFETAAIIRDEIKALKEMEEEQSGKKNKSKKKKD